MTEKEQNREEIQEESAEAEKAEAADKPEEASPDETLGAEIPEENGEENLQAALDEANDKYMRLAAEYQNYRRRTDAEKTSIAQYANERIAKELLNVVDNFERALAAAEGDESVKSGVELIYKQLMGVLSNFGVSVIETEGKEFDPNFHNAVLSEEAEGVEPGQILMELQKGYMLNDRLLRPSMVKVSV
ncbi:MAG: nucleotide exchange factor GrpE [Firmicutes bacterium]|nr:nucleotide exchange factor GrpE [Bacillota bacterium]